MVPVPAGPALTSTRTGARKFVPVMVTTVPPAGGPVLGVTLVMVGAVEGVGGMIGASLNEILMLLVTLLTVAVTVETPAVEFVSTTVATPLVVVLMVRTSLTSVKVPLSVTNSTAVPLTTGCPFCVTVAVMVTSESTCTAVELAVRTRLAPTGGVTPPLLFEPPPLPEGGAVGDSALQPINAAISAISRMTDRLRFMLNMLNHLRITRDALTAGSRRSRSKRREE